MKDEKTIGHRDVVRRLSNETNITFRAMERVLDMYLDIITEQIANGKNVTIKNIGTIKVLPTPAKVGRDIKTGGRIDRPPGKRVKLQACATLRNILKE